MLNTVLLLRKFLRVVSKEDVKEFPKYIDLQKWKNYEYLGWFFTIIVFLIITLGLSEDVKDLIYFIIRSNKRKR